MSENRVGFREVDKLTVLQRPNLNAPRWDIRVYNSDKLSKGYWFPAPKPSQERTIGSGEGWWGPAIYDQDGELVWSGADQLDTPNVMDFRVSKVRDGHLLTMLDRDRRSAVMLDNTYEVRDIVDVTSTSGVNGHELNFVDDGTRMLFISNEQRDAPDVDKEAVGWDGGECFASYNGFVELDVTNNFEKTFEWSAYDKIRLNESTLTGNSLHKRCNNNWDFM